MANELQNKVFQDADKARQWLETHLWPGGPVCGYCGTVASGVIKAGCLRITGKTRQER